MKKMVNCTLLIDDDDINNFLNKRLINKLKISHDVKVVLNGAEALKFIDELCTEGKECPELILLDINMPVMNGFEFLKAYDKLEFANKPNVKVVMLTTSSNPYDLEKLHEYKVSGFINKPLTEENLMEVVMANFNVED
ncbi:MAG TPA: response regulator [Cytophagales bacterium]|nr:response regulator [Cytophagales bacterium]